MLEVVVAVAIVAIVALFVFVLLAVSLRRSPSVPGGRRQDSRTEPGDAPSHIAAQRVSSAVRGARDRRQGTWESVEGASKRQVATTRVCPGVDVTIDAEAVTIRIDLSNKAFWPTVHHGARGIAIVGKWDDRDDCVEVGRDPVTGRRLPAAAREAGTGPAGARRPGLRRAREAGVRGRPLRELLLDAIATASSRASIPPSTRRSTGRRYRTCSRSGSSSTTRWTSAACSACARRWSGPRRAGATGSRCGLLPGAPRPGGVRVAGG